MKKNQYFFRKIIAANYEEKISNDKFFLHTPNTSESDENVTYIKLVYVEDLTERISNTLKKENEIIAQKPENTVKSFHSKL